MSRRRKPKTERQTTVKFSRAGNYSARLQGKTWVGHCVDHRGVPKRVYATHHDATQAAKGLVIGGSATDTKRHKIGPYACDRCGGYHVGHSSEKRQTTSLKE